MKTIVPDIVSVSRGALSSNTYKVAQTAKMMRMLSKDLYKDHVSAPIRELSTNAWDSHIMAENMDQLPIINLPTYDNLEFSIRDFGTGMSPEKMVTMYRTYGASDKTDNNLLNGCMGIGSKAPFAYCDSFTSTTFYNGMKYVYINAKNKEGIPSINLFHSEPTTEPNGMRISFACKEKDIHEFRNKTVKILRWFPKQFVVHVGNEVDNTFAIEPYEYSMQSADGDWLIRKDKNDTESYVVMGNVRYPISQSFFASDKSQVRDNDWYSYYDHSPIIKMLNLGLELRLELGEVDFDISREALQYSDFTIEAIKAKLNEVMDTIKVKIESEFASCTSLWDARILYQELNEGKLKDLMSIAAFVHPEFNGVKVNSKPINLSKETKDSMNIISFDWCLHKQQYKKLYNYQTIAADDNTVIYIADMGTGNHLAAMRDAGDDKRLYVVTPNANVSGNVDSLAKDLGMNDNSKFKLCSSVPKLVKVPGVKVISGSKSNEKVFTLDTEVSFNRYSRRGQAWKSKYWKPAIVDFKAGGVYIEINAWESTDSNALSVDGMTEMIKRLEEYDIEVPEVVGVKSVAVKRYADATQWITFRQWANSAVEAYIAAHDTVDMLSCMDYHAENQEMFSRYEALLKNASVPLEKVDNSIKTFVDKMNLLGILVAEDKGIRNVATTLGITSKGIHPVVGELITLKQEIDTKYAILTLFNAWELRYESASNIVMNVINIIDKGNE